MSDVHDKVTLDYNPVTQRHVEVEQKDGLLIVRETVPKELITKYIEANKAEYNAIAHKSYRTELRKKNMWRAASIPNIVVEQWKREGIDIFKDEDWPKVRAKLNSEEYKFLRTSPGKI